MKAWNKSRCANSWLHRFKIVGQSPEGVLEECEICHKRVFFKVIEGKTDNNFYLSYHIRQALPPQHPLFNREYAKS